MTCEIFTSRRTVGLGTQQPPRVPYPGSAIQEAGVKAGKRKGVVSIPSGLSRLRRTFENQHKITIKSNLTASYFHAIRTVTPSGPGLSSCRTPAGTSQNSPG